MSGIDLANGTVAGFAGPLKSGELSPVELTRATLERIDRVDGPLRGFTTVTGDYALAAGAGRGGGDPERRV